MVFEPFRTDRLAKNQTSSPIEFVVLLGAEQTFLRVIAHSKPNVVHGGRPPTFLISAGLGGPTAVDEGTDPVDIPGSGGATVATAACHRTTEEDTYLVTINHSAPSGPWQVEIENNEPEGLEFVGFISHMEDETLQSWAEFSEPQLQGGEAETIHEIRVHNIGTKPLIIADLSGSQLGGSGSPCVIKARPDPIAPHDADFITVKCNPLPQSFGGRSETFMHTFSSNDPNLSHSQITFEVVFPTPPSVPRTMCHMRGGCTARCREFDPLPFDHFQCATCTHDAGFHGLPSRPPGPFER
ncbi:hypothetical protein [Streptomyces bobili]